jgi:hypothetical protein
VDVFIAEPEVPVKVTKPSFITRPGLSEIDLVSVKAPLYHQPISVTNKIRLWFCTVPSDIWRPVWTTALNWVFAEALKL